MSRLVVVSNRVAPIKAGKVAAGGLAVGIHDALRQSGGIWFGWSGEVSASAGIGREAVRATAEPPLAFPKRGFDQQYGGFSMTAVCPLYHYRTEPAHYPPEEYEGYRRLNAQLHGKLK